MAIYFGGDLSSTKVSLVAIDGRTMKRVGTYRASIDDIAHSMGIQTKDGMVEGPDGLVTVPGRVLVKAVQDVMQQAANDSSFDNADVRAGSWSVQGHLGVYLRQGAAERLRSPDLTGDLSTLMEPFFTCDCPTWKDSSTSAQVAVLNHKMREAGVPVIVMAERYPGPQIAKRVKTSAYDDASHFMVGNALPSFIITGVRTFSGPGDAAASGFVNLENLTLCKEAADIIDEGLISKVAPVTAAGGYIGPASPFFRRTGFTNLHMYVGDQDNVKSAAYLICGDRVLQVSLGTSYTVSNTATSPLPGFEGNFASNDKSRPYLLLLTKRNGSSSIVATLVAHGKGEKEFGLISPALAATPVGNDGAMALPHYGSEIIPYNPSGVAIIREGYNTDATFPIDMRAVIEGNAASMKIWTNHYLGKGFNALSFAGGATNNMDIVQAWVNVFGVPGYLMNNSDDAAAIGAALTAMADSDGRRSLQTVQRAFLRANQPQIVTVDERAAAFYQKTFLPAYQAFEAKHIQARR